MEHSHNAEMHSHPEEDFIGMEKAFEETDLPQDTTDFMDSADSPSNSAPERNAAGSEEEDAQEQPPQKEELIRRAYELKKEKRLVQELFAAVEKENAVLAQREANIILREQQLAAQEAAAAGKRREENAAQEQELAAIRAAAEQELAQMRLREEQKLTEELAQQRREAVSALSKETASLREDSFLQLNEELARERATRLQLLNAEKTACLETLDKERAALEQQEKELADQKRELGKEKRRLSEQQDALDFERARMTAREKQLDSKQQRLSEDVDRALTDERKTMTAELAKAREAADRLRDRLCGVQEELNACKDIQAVWGTDPAVLLKQMEELRENNQLLKDELAKCPSQAVEDERQRLQSEKQTLEERYRILQAEKERFDRADAELQRLQRENSRLEEQLKALDFDVKEYKARCDEYRAKLERYRSPENLVQGRAERIQEIRRPYLKGIPDQRKIDQPNMEADQPQDELIWLAGIEKACADYGISFPKRILYAFHTSLKIADWSSITVLAGVSGTGKSELPRLYSIFGGINFISVPVQPNWDSQESMLGYFNSIDNRFDAQPLLRFLAQCTNLEPNDPNNPALVDPSKPPYPLGKYMSIVLLDEMNLAHVEHYFADFLSKLESRRGLPRAEVPHIEVKLGTGYEPFELKLSRNVLWVGTMNQDETTKSLSDKVLDRGIVIHFPRPTTLNSRSGMKSLEKGRNNTLLKYSTWYKWCRRETGFTSESLRAEIDHYRHFVENINDQLERSGRAIGHRVWQSIEFYLANYPTVIASMTPGEDEMPPALRAAMKTAFEDQIVQKIMPKLRGIETRGDGKRQLDTIKQMLQDDGFDDLLEDFENACSRGYGQFVWSSAHYLEKEEETEFLQSESDGE